MTYEQIFIFSLMAAVLVMLIWGRVRYDLVAFGALIIGVIGGVIDPHDAFLGLSHEAVVIIALVLIASRAMMNSGAVELIAGFVVSADRPLPVHIGLMSLVGAALSAVINNVAALVLLMSLDIEVAKKAKRAISLSLMPLSFATILGGMITLIGTPPNIVIAQYRARVEGAPFAMFDFAPVGLVVAIAGIAFVTLIGWRLIPQPKQRVEAGETEDELFVAEAKVPEGSVAIGKQVSDLFETGEEHDVALLGLVRRGKRLPGFAGSEEIRKNDAIVVEGATQSIEAFIGAVGLQAAGSEKHGGLTGKSLKLVEAIVPAGSRLEGRTANELRLLNRRGVALLGVARQGNRFRQRVRNLPIKPGDVVLLLGTGERVNDTAEWLGVLPIADRDHSIIQRRKALLAIGVFAAAIAASVAGLVPLVISLAAAVCIYAIFNLVGPTEVYQSIEWPVLILLASMIPIGLALEQTGGTALIANTILGRTASLPIWAILTVIMIITMTLSDVLNNVATALIAAPIATDIARSLEVSQDPFLMGVAVAASCAFLSPIGHKNNTIIMGPGGYRFGDYWRMGLPLEVIVIVVGVPAILFFWPL